MANEAVRKAMTGYHDLLESGRREIYRIESGMNMPVGNRGEEYDAGAEVLVQEHRGPVQREGVTVKPCCSAFLAGATILFSANMSAQTTSLEARDHNLVVAGPGELEVAVSGNGEQVVLAVNAVRPLDVPPTRSRLFFSADRGATFTAVATLPNRMRGSRDPTVTWTGAGKFYFATMGATTNVRVAASTNGGASFAAVTTLTCRGTGCTGDQPHMAGDRRPGQDQVYIVWRNRSTGRFGSGGRFYSAIGCSADGGQTWFRRIVERNVRPTDRRGDYPRVTVGPDGFAYVVMASARTNGQILLQRFSPCSNGLLPLWTQGGESAPSAIASFSGVRCESSIFGPNTIAGLDRCNNGNILASHTVAVDDTDARRVFVSYADEVSPGNHDIVLVSTQNVTTLPRNQPFADRRIVNVESSGERYMPWSCATEGQVYVAWYDRRSKTTRNNDNTEYFVGDDDRRQVDASDSIDRQCASGWPSGGARQESEACSRQPQRAGFCLPCPTGSRVGVGCAATPAPTTPRCDYTSGCAAAGLGCVEPARNRGNGRYGDYNGIACAQGSAYVAWASANNPSTLPDVNSLSVFFARVDRVSRPAPPPPSPECKECRDDRTSCLNLADSSTDTRACVQEYNRCRAKNNCR